MKTNFTRLISAYRNQNKAFTVTKIHTYSEILWTNGKVEAQVSISELLFITKPLLLSKHRSLSHWVFTSLRKHK